VQAASVQHHGLGLPRSLKGAEAVDVGGAIAGAFVLEGAAVFERTGEPEGGVNAGDHEGADEEGGHAPEGVKKEDGIADRVMVGGVGEVAGELAVGVFAALSAGFDDVLAAQAGSVTGRISWAPWQSLQVGASWLPFAAICPCVEER
jgi:hypothetical protein